MQDLLFPFLLSHDGFMGGFFFISKLCQSCFLSYEAFLTISGSYVSLLNYHQDHFGSW